jgi:PucR family transcriptional regulator, purine catabolism regulatory protein
MAFTLSDILELDLLREAEAEVVAGRDHLDRQVRWVHMSEQPDVARYLKGGELLFTTGMGLGLNETLQARYISELAEAGLSGLVIRLGGTWKELPSTLVREAEQLRLPVIVLHRRFGLVALTEEIHGAIISRQYQLLKRAESIGRRFTDLFMKGAGVAEILEELASIVQSPAVLEDPAHQLMDFATHGQPQAEVVSRWSGFSRRDWFDDPSGKTAGVSPAGIWADVWVRGDRWGRLHVLEWDRRLDEIDELAVDRAVAAVALALLADADRRSRTDRARDNLIADILGDRYGGDAGFFTRAESCRVQFGGRTLTALALVCRGLGAVFDEDDASEGDRTRVRRRLQRGAQRAIESAGLVALSGLDGDVVLAIVGVEAGASLRSALDVAGSAMAQAASGAVAGVSPVVGASLASSPKALHQAFAQATEAAESAGETQLHQPVVHFADLGLHHLLLQLNDGPELARFVEGELRPLLDHDARQRSKLVATLRAHLECGGNKTRAANILCIQRRSLYHRLERIRHILGADPDNQETNLRLRVAFRGLDLLEHRSRAH